MIERENMTGWPEAIKQRYERQYQLAEEAINVGDLIRILQSYPDDLPVVCDCDFIEHIRIQDDWPIGDPGHPYGCAECRVLKIE